MALFNDSDIILSVGHGSLPLDQFVSIGIISAFADKGLFSSRDSMVQDCMAKIIAEAKERNLKAIINIRVEIGPYTENFIHCFIYGDGLVSRS